MALSDIIAGFKDRYGEGREDHHIGILRRKKS